ncbi:MAG: type VI secretion system tip protein TssI/VgrG [Planctomycetota bacterium]
MAKKNRIHRILSALKPLENDDRLILDEMLYEDEFGRPFKCTLKVLSRDHSIKDEDLLGTTLTVKYEPKDKQVRYFDGIVSEMTYLGITEGYSQYQIVTRPWFWFLTHTTNSRIFQEKTVVQIVESIFKDTHGFTDFKKSLSGQFAKRVYCSQYQESDFDFVSRLLEEEGIYYFFEHEEGKHTLVLVDDTATHKPIKGDEKVPFRLPGDAPVDLKHIWHWTIHSQLQTTKLVTNDYDFENPKASLEVDSTIKRKHKHAKFEKFEFPGRYVEKKDGSQYVKRRTEEEQVEFNQFRGESDQMNLATGFFFKMEDHPRQDQNKVDYVVCHSSVRLVSAEIEMFSARENEIDIQFRTIKKSSPFRTNRTTPRPVVTGPQSALVVGKKGEEIWTDKYGRIKVQFPWDREGKKDENSSCWIRVSQTWAGKGWGSIHIPRVGQEVLVEFLDGDPDRPIVTGRVYNADQTLPYALPANQTQSGIKSRSSKKGKDDNFNELRFEDKKGEEQIYFHAERDFEQVIENDATIKIGLDTKDKGNQTIEIHNDRSLTINEGNETIEIKKGNQTTKISKGDKSVKTSSGKQTYTAGKQIELKVGGSSIKITSNQIVIKSPKIVLKGGTAVDVKSTVTTVKGTASLGLKGGMTRIN